MLIGIYIFILCWIIRYLFFKNSNPNNQQISTNMFQQTQPNDDNCWILHNMYSTYKRIDQTNNVMQYIYIMYIYI